MSSKNSHYNDVEDSKNDYYNIAEEKSSSRDSNSHKESQQEGKEVVDLEDQSEADDRLIGKVGDFLFQNDDFAGSLEEFIKSKSDIVDLQNEEYKLQYTQIFIEYKKLFEKGVEDYLETTLKSSAIELYSALNRKIEKDKDSNEAFLAQILVAVTDFDVFMTMMKESKRAADRFSHK